MLRAARQLAAVLLVVLVTSGSSFGVVGDSIAHDAREELRARGAIVLSAPGVFIQTGRPGVREHVQAGRDRVVVALGMMDVSLWATSAQLERRIRPVLGEDLAGVDCVVWVDLKTTSPLHANWPTRAGEFNTLIARLTARFGDHVARWSVFSVRHPDWFRPDGIHLRPAGQQAYARFLATQVSRYC